MTAARAGATPGDGGAIGPELAMLAAEYGVATGYADWAGRPVEIPADVVVRTLGALGVDATRPAAALAAVRAERAGRLLPPTVVATGGVPGGFRVPASSGDAAVECEDGSRLRWEFTGGQLTLPADL